MKRKVILIFAIAVLAVCALAITVSAQESEYYLVQSLDSDAAIALQNEGKTNIVSVWDLYADAENCLFNGMSDGDSVTLNLAENLKSSTSDILTRDINTMPAIRLDKAITVTVNFGGYGWWMSENGYSGFVLFNENATLNLMGTKAKNPDGTFKTISKNYDEELRYSELDIYCDFVVAYQAAGKLYCENLAVSCNEDTVYQKETYLKGYCLLELVDSSVLTRGNFPTLSLTGKSNSKNDLKINGGRYGTVVMHNLNEISYIKNATLLNTYGSNSLYIDSWNSNRNSIELPVENSIFEGRYWAEGDVNVIVAKNSNFATLYLKGDNSGGAYMTIIDSTYTSVDFSGNKGTGQLTVITSATCNDTGSNTIYTIDGLASEEIIPAQGHLFDSKNIIDIAYVNYLENGKYTSKCARCGDGTATEVNGTALPLFICKGYSAPEDGSNGIVIGYTVNNAAIKEYTEITGKTLKYGVFAVAKDKLGTNDVFAENGTLATGVITAEISDHGFAAFELKIVGFTDTYKDTKLAIGAYVEVTDGKTTEYSYMQSGTPVDNEKYCFTSYNEVINSKSTADDGETQ